MILDAGPTAGREPSTLVDLSSTEPRLVRAGAVPPDEVASILGGRLAPPGGAAR
jgi:tRNA A37 threonylcarbamoyladenosine synthetase subunit TsaC/SUA5/YrdC